MPGLPFQELPVAREDPTTIIQNRYEDTQQYIKSQYANEVKNLESQFLTDEDFQIQVNDINSKYQGIINKEAYKIKQQTGQLQTIRTLVNQGLISTDAGERAAWRIVLPAETGQAMFQAQPKGRVPFSPGQLTAYGGFMRPYAEAAKTSGWGLTGYKREQEDLIKQYVAARDQAGYDDPTWTPRQRQQFDTEWDLLMNEDRDYKWNPESPEIKSLRAVGKLAKAATKNISPLGASVAKKKRFTMPTEPMFFGMEVAQKIVSPELKPKARYMTEPDTGQRAVTYDNGKTWQIVK